MDPQTNAVSLNGSVQRQGVKLDIRDWLDIGSPTWRTTSEKDKAAAYQAAQVTGWKDAGLKKLILDLWKSRIDEDMANFTIETLKEYAVKYPVEVEEVYKTEAKDPVFRIQGCEKTIPFPKNDGN